MQPVQSDDSKNVLLALLHELEQPVPMEEIAVENAPDTIDRVQNAAQRELAIRRIESGFSRLQSIRLALQRVEDGTYGICMRCGDGISHKRLSAVPWALYCLTCQEIADRENKEHESLELLRWA